MCSARPISSQPVGRPSVQWGLPDEQRWTTVHSVTPFPSSDPWPQPCRPSGIFQVMHSSNSQPFLQVKHIRTFKAGPAGQHRRFNLSIRFLLTERLEDSQLVEIQAFLIKKKKSLLQFCKFLDRKLRGLLLMTDTAVS